MGRQEADCILCWRQSNRKPRSRNSPQPNFQRVGTEKSAFPCRSDAVPDIGICTSQSRLAAGRTIPSVQSSQFSPELFPRIICLFSGYFSRPGEIEHDYRGLLRVPYPALHSDGIVSADPEHSDPDMTGLGLSKTSFTDR